MANLNLLSFLNLRKYREDQVKEWDYNKAAINFKYQKEKKIFLQPIKIRETPSRLYFLYIFQ
jgi:hypothetical protein